MNIYAETISKTVRYHVRARGPPENPHCKSQEPRTPQAVPAAAPPVPSGTASSSGDVNLSVAQQEDVEAAGREAMYGDLEELTSEEGEWLVAGRLEDRRSLPASGG